MLQSVEVMSDPPITADSLAAELHARGVFCCDTTLGAASALALPAMPGTVMAHIVLEGECAIRVRGTTTRLAPGQVALVSHGEGHDVLGHRGEGASPVPLVSAPRVALGGVLERLVLSECSSPHARMICTALTLDHPAAPALPAALDSVLVATLGDERPGRADALIDLISLESASRSPGWVDVTARLTDALVLVALREVIATVPEGHGWWAALQEPRIAACLAAVQERPGEDWSVERLARHASLSRSAFHDLFVRTLGITPSAWVTETRMRLAERMLRTGRSVSEVARATGYTSEAAFRKAFRREIGIPPGALRNTEDHT